MTRRQTRPRAGTGDPARPSMTAPAKAAPARLHGGPPSRPPP